MAEVVDDRVMNFVGRYVTHSRRKYPWHKWLDGKTWRIAKGTDFEPSVESLKRAAYLAAARRGLNVSFVNEGAGVLFIRATKEPKPLVAAMGRRAE